MFMYVINIGVQDRECNCSLYSGVIEYYSKRRSSTLVVEVNHVPGRSEATAGRWNPRLTVGRWLVEDD